MREFTDLQVWQEAHRLTLMVYTATAQYPKEELFGLTRQTREAVVSVEANIAEGHGRYRSREFHRFCQIAHGSLAETRCPLLVARDLAYLPHDRWQPLEAQALSVLKLLQAFMRSLESQPP
jgi:four helix bundle protein